MKGPLFFAKILLFGEYGIIKDSKFFDWLQKNGKKIINDNNIEVNLV